MQHIVIRLLCAAIAMKLADVVLTGLEVRGLEALALGSLVLATAHATVRPLLGLLTFPITVVTLGASLWVTNALLLWGTAWLVPGVEVRGVLPALLGALLISIFAGAAQLLLAPEDASDRS